MFETTNQKNIRNLLNHHPGKKNPSPIRSHLGSRGRIWCWAEPSAGHCSWWPRKLPIWIKCAENIGWKYRLGGCRWGGAFHSVHFFVHNELAHHHPSSSPVSFSYLLSPCEILRDVLQAAMTTNTYHHLQGSSTWFPIHIFHDLTHVDLKPRWTFSWSSTSQAIYGHLHQRSNGDSDQQNIAKPCSRMKTLLMLSFWICCHMCISNISISFNFTIETCSSPHSPSCSRPVPRSWHPTFASVQELASCWDQVRVVLPEPPTATSQELSWWAQAPNVRQKMSK